MKSFIALLASLVFLAVAAHASAAVEVLPPETAVRDLADSSGVVLVDLYADW